MDWFRNKDSDTGVVSFCVLTEENDLRVSFDFDKEKVLTVESYRRYKIELYDFEECSEEDVPDAVVEKVEDFV